MPFTVRRSVFTRWRSKIAIRSVHSGLLLILSIFVRHFARKADDVEQFLVALKCSKNAALITRPFAAAPFEGKQLKNALSR